MLIEVGSPATLPLGLVKFDDPSGSKTCLLGLTVQHPPIQLFAQQHPNRLLITGPRADVGYDYAQRFLNHHQLKQQAEVEIEHAIPSLVGLGSETMLALSIAKALAWVHDLPPEKRDKTALAQTLELGTGPRQALEIWGFERGGLLLIEVDPATETGLPSLLQRQEIKHKEREAWAFVFYFPGDTDEIPETWESDRWTALLQATAYLSPETGRLVRKDLWPAAEQDDLDAFGKSLLALHHLNEEALAKATLAKAGALPAPNPEHQAIFDLMRNSGAVAWGQNLTGLSLYGLIKGGQASRDLRTQLRKHIGYFGGTIMATITDNNGAGEAVQDRRLDEGRMKPLRLNIPP